MNPEVKKQWVEALRSGKYKQGRLHLEKNGKFCCLGVLCDLYSKAHGDVPISDLAAPGSVPGRLVQEWAGLDRANPVVCIDGFRASLSYHNDGDLLNGVTQTSFAKIADAIEEQL